MKNIIRALVLTLAVVGFASQHALTAQAKVSTVGPVVTVNHAGAPPAPTCDPATPKACGWGSWGNQGK